MSKIPPRKRKQSGRSLRLICRKLKLPFHKTRQPIRALATKDRTA